MDTLVPQHRKRAKHDGKTPNNAYLEVSIGLVGITRRSLDSLARIGLLPFSGGRIRAVRGDIALFRRYLGERAMVGAPGLYGWAILVYRLSPLTSTLLMSSLKGEGNRYGDITSGLPTGDTFAERTAGSFLVRPVKFNGDKGEFRRLVYTPCSTPYFFASRKYVVVISFLLQFRRCI
jgi:hypothetical protein